MDCSKVTRMKKCLKYETSSVSNIFQRQLKKRLEATLKNVFLLTFMLLSC